MADTRDGEPSGGQRLPIKVILPNQGRETPVKGGGKGKQFREVTMEYRASLHTQVEAIQNSVTSVVAERVGGVPVRVKILPNAVAKSHRPVHLFSDNTCPIIGGGALGELFIKGTPVGLAKLGEMIESNQSERIVQELSSVEVIEPITPAFRRGKATSVDILKHSPRRRDSFLTRITLYDYSESAEQDRLVEDFFNSAKKAKVEVRQAGYSANSFTFEAACQSVDQVEEMSRVVGVRSISPMPVLRSILPQDLNLKAVIEGLPRAENLNGDSPIVAVVDSGISETNPDLATWIVGRESFVAEQYLNPTHGTFVAGLICWGSLLNPQLKDISQGPCRVFDVQILPNSDPKRGETETIGESEFLESLDIALRQHSNSIKVWNLSLSTNEVCSLDDFSSFAKQLDDLQEKYQVSFVISAGNYNSVPLLDYPREGEQLRNGRITSPADSVLGITVGSISHVDHKSKGPKANQPSAFSRHGPGPNYIIKPDIVHYGGSCSTDAREILGVRSITANESREDIGTSFSTPLVSRALAETYHHVTPTPSPVLARALLTHHARDPRSGGRIPDGEEDYFGFGRPVPPPYCLECTPYSSTLVFEDTLRPGYFLEWNDFPYPQSLTRNGRYYGEIWMTVAFAPTRGEQYGTEYCETHIEASFGVYLTRTRKKTGGQYTEFQGLVPPEHKNPGLLYESYQVEKLRKWAPVRTYYGNLGPKGERGHKWRLLLRLLSRHEVNQDKQTAKPQPFSLIVTITDPEKKAPVYDEMAKTIRNRFQSENLIVRATTQVRTRT